MNFFRTIAKDLLSYAFPEICIACHCENRLRNSAFCLFCQSDLPYTASFEYEEHELYQKLLGRVQFEQAAFLFYQYKSGKIIECVHALKYKHQANIGILLGKEFGLKWIENQRAIPDAIVPVPLHPRKKAKRGYNQSTMFALGVQQVIHKPIIENMLVKRTSTSSQTNKGRLDRLQNLEETFDVIPKRHWQNKKLLVVDDVVTTGATLETCGILLNRHVSDNLYFGAIALARS